MLATQETGTAALRHQDSSPASAREASSEPREFTGRKVKVPHGPETWFGFTRTPILASTEGGKLFAAASFERVKMPSGGKQMLLQDVVRIPTIPPCCSEGRRPVVPKDSGRVFRVIAATCSE